MCPADLVIDAVYNMWPFAAVALLACGYVAGYWRASR
jgi:hypothetical protein